MIDKKKKIQILFILAAAFITLFILWGLNANNYQYNLYVRIPKVIAIVISGAAIAVASILFQSVTQNRIVTPSILGLDSLYNLVQTTVVFVFGSASVFMTNKPINFVVSSILMIGLSMILFKVVLKKGKNNIFLLLLVGTVIGTFFRSFASFMQVSIDPNEYDALQNKLYASFNLVNTDILIVVLVVLLLIFIALYDDIKKLDLASLGRDLAINLGLNYDKFTKKILLIVAVLISVSTALVGPITFLGILIVNLTYEMIKSHKHSELLVVGILISIIALVGGQFLVERLFNFNTKISIIINFIGGIYFIGLLLKEGKS
ncbi:MAG: iron chelate uptake ABC transporter family permease subunit [Clostridiales bacterium]|jgi:iron complex transport system permease protein|nr:iron chelate uptake ABC transporter family permease subunit [Clostridiales bacterium]